MRGYCSEKRALMPSISESDGSRADIFYQPGDVAIRRMMKQDAVTPCARHLAAGAAGDCNETEIERLCMSMGDD